MVQQKLIQYCKAIILKLKIKYREKKKKKDSHVPSLKVIIRAL